METATMMPTPLFLLVFLALPTQDPRGDERQVGIVRPMRWSRIAAEVDGRVLVRLVEEHEFVSAGTAVIKIEPTLKAAALKSAEAALLEARARHKWAMIELERHRRLLLEDSSAQADIDRSEAAERAAFAAVMSAEAAVSEAGFRLARTTVQAPFDGVIAQFEIEENEYAVPGRLLFSIMDIRRVKIESFVDSTTVRNLHKGDAVTVDSGTTTIRAVVASVAPGTDNDSRTFKVVLHAENSDAGDGPMLRPGCTVEWRLADVKKR